MQMRRNYESTNKVTRILSMRASAKECHEKGFAGFAAALEELAQLLQDELDAADKAARKAARVEADTDPDFTPPVIA